VVGGPCLVNQQRQVVYPVILTYAARIDHMREIIFCVGDNEIRMSNSVVAVPGFCHLSDWNPGRLLDCPERVFRSGQTDEALIEMVEPAAEYCRRVPRGVCGNED